MTDPFSSRLRQARWDRNLSVRDAAKEAGVSPGLWSNIENSRRSAGPTARPLLEAWLAETPSPFPPRRVDDALAVLEEYGSRLDDARRDRIRGIIG